MNIASSVSTAHAAMPVTKHKAKHPIKAATASATSSTKATAATAASTMTESIKADEETPAAVTSFSPQAQAALKGADGDKDAH